MNTQFENSLLSFWSYSVFNIHSFFTSHSPCECSCRILYYNTYASAKTSVGHLQRRIISWNFHIKSSFPCVITIYCSYKEEWDQKPTTQTLDGSQRAGAMALTIYEQSERGYKNYVHITPFSKNLWKRLKSIEFMTPVWIFVSCLDFAKATLFHFLLRPLSPHFCAAYILLSKMNKVELIVIETIMECLKRDQQGGNEILCLNYSNKDIFNK